MLSRSGLFDALRQIAGDIVVPATVYTECTRDARKPGVSTLVEARTLGLFTVASDPDPACHIPRVAHLDAGEIMALTLAQYRRCPVLMDESLGRKVAARNGIPVVGCAGILLAAKERGLISEVAPILKSWQHWGYFLVPALLDAVLARAGETRHD